MKITLYIRFLLLIFVILTFVPNSFAQATPPHNVVRVVHFVPSDRTPQRDINAKLDTLMKEVQTFFADEMERHGFGRKTFALETDAEGEVVVHRINGRKADAYYHTETRNRVTTEISLQRFYSDKNIYVAIVDVSTEQIGARIGPTIGTFCGVGGHRRQNTGDLGGSAFIPASGHCFNLEITAHELGHTFGLYHDFGNDAYIMSYGFKTELAPCTAEWLDAHRYFNSRQTPPNNSRTVIRILQVAASPPYGMRYRFQVSDSDGLQIAQLLTPATDKREAPGQPKLIGCQKLAGQSQVVEFVTTELTAQSELISIHVVDGAGNWTSSRHASQVSGIFPSEVISIPDANLAAAVRESLELPQRHRLRHLDMLALRELAAAGREISDLSGLEHARNLKYLFLENNQIRDITAITELTSLAVLNLLDNPIEDTRPARDLPQVHSLQLPRNQVHNPPLEPVTPRPRPAQNPDSEPDMDTPERDSDVVLISDRNLAAAVRKTLGLGRDARITKQALRGLTRLDARDSQIKNLSGLEHATRLSGLELRRNQIRDIRPVSNLKSLKELVLDSNRVSDIRPLAKMKQLTWLLIGGNPISDFTPLTNLTELRGLSLWGNNISDVTLFADLTKLTSLWLGRNKISNITPLADLVNLKVLSLYDNQIRDVSPLAGLVNLETLHLDGNPIQDTSPLASLTKLRDVDIEISQGGAKAGPKIEGPWLWMIVSTGENGGGAAASSGQDWLATASGGSVTEQQIAMNGATAGNPVGNRVWASGKLAPTGSDNITDMVNAIGLGTGNNIDNHVAYGSISLLSPRKQNTMMYVGSDDAVKVWLNGKLVHDYLFDRGASDYQDSSPVTLKLGKNTLLVAVYELRGGWSGFFGFENDAAYSIAPTVTVSASERPPMYWVNMQRGTLHRLVGDEVEDLVPNVQNATNLAIDIANEKLYWTEKTSNTTGRIRRANLDGTSVQLVKDLTSVPHGITLDAAGGKIYLTNAWGKVQRLNVDGSNFQPNFITGLDTPKGLTLDVLGGKVYWAEMAGRIRRANLDGSNIEDIATGLGTPMDLIVFDGTVYWTEKTGENRGDIRFVALDRNRNVVTRNTFTQGFPVGIALDTVDGKLYWTTSHGKIGRQALDGSNFQPNFVTGLSAPGTLALRVETPMDVETPVVATTDAVVSVSPSPVISPAVGERLTLNLKITAGEAVAGYQFTVRFDPTALRYVESGNGEYLPTGAFFVQPVVNRDRVELAATALAGVSNGDGTLATLTFEVMAVKPSTLTLSEPLFADDQGNTFLPQVEGGEITEPPKLKGNVNGDGVVNIQDLVLVASSFGETGENSADINADGVVNIADLVLVAGALGAMAAAPSIHAESLKLLTAADVRQWLSQAHRLNGSHVDYQRGLLVLEQLLTALAPKETLLLPNYPNPFNPETWIPYQLATSGDVKITIYDARGVVVRRLELGYRQAGYYTNRSRSAYWDGCNGLGEHVASGLYFYHLEAEGVSLLRKMVTLK